MIFIVDWFALSAFKEKPHCKSIITLEKANCLLISDSLCKLLCLALRKLLNWVNYDIAVCEALSEASAFIVDVSYGNQEELKEIANTFGISYIKIDIGISPALKLLDAYLELRNSSDVAILFENGERKLLNLLKCIPNISNIYS